MTERILTRFCLVLNTTRILEDTTEKLKRSLKRTQQMMTLLNETDHTDLEFPFQILDPFLVLLQYQFNQIQNIKLTKSNNRIASDVRIN